MKQKIEIPLSKTKMTLFLMGAIVFVVMGVFFAMEPARFISPVFRSEGLVRIAGVASVLFFGLGAVYMLRKLFDKKVGLTICEAGITDNSSAVSVGLIEWQDITGVETLEIASNKILLVHTNNPEKYMARGTNIFSRKAMQANHRMYGTPLSITANSLQITYKELERLVCEELENKSVR
ncbi:STM3941 family protein [Pontibacter sp. BT731]|uniref:STM3941 family protein n=1 Tax=Pontibacter coccineus TaxID=3063328 RepID=UPI0026E46845|nr:STM3941 family protein [Pontibacter sp. BT731]MDO6390003.1 STM3941 family protein [Pontibacter sp. BT731]